MLDGKCTYCLLKAAQPCSACQDGDKIQLQKMCGYNVKERTNE